VPEPGRRRSVLSGAEGFFAPTLAEVAALAVERMGESAVFVWRSVNCEGWRGPSAVWTSPDGLTWTPVPHDEAIFGGGDAAVWTSPDGVTWARVTHDEAVFGGDGNQWMVSVVAVGPGLVAVGCDVSGGDILDGDWDAAVWHWEPSQ